jgi:hypothetical protein
VWGLHIHNDYIFTCSDDATVRCWSLKDRLLLCCSSLNVGPEGLNLEKDKKTNDFSEASKGRAIGVSPNGKFVVVGCKNGTVRLYSFDSNKNEIKFAQMFRHAK